MELKVHLDNPVLWELQDQMVLPDYLGPVARLDRLDRLEDLDQVVRWDHQESKDHRVVQVQLGE